MASDTPLCLVTPRDLDLFQALNLGPLTVRQVLKLSETFAYPFTTERRVQERLQRLCAADRVRRWRYATAGQGALSYYTLSPLGYRLLHGPEAAPSSRGLFSPVGVARQAHTRALAEVTVHLRVGAHRAGTTLDNVCRENTVRLHLDQESLYPDGVFELMPVLGPRYSFYLELDNCTETVRTGSTLDSWGRKVKFYEAYQDAHPGRFRVLILTTGGELRLRHMLECAASHARNPRRSLVYGASVRAFLATENPVLGSCFQNHLGAAVSLVPRFEDRVRMAPAPAAALAQATCVC